MNKQENKIRNKKTIKLYEDYDEANRLLRRKKIIMKKEDH